MSALRGLVGNVSVFAEGRKLYGRIGLNRAQLLRKSNLGFIESIGSGDSMLSWKFLKVKEVRVRYGSRPSCNMMQERRQSMQIMHQNLSAILFPGYRRRVLGMLLLHPEDAFHGRGSRSRGSRNATLDRASVVQ
jgi:hypothetical protein